jgi:hypothetical protein
MEYKKSYNNKVVNIYNFALKVYIMHNILLTNMMHSRSGRKKGGALEAFYDGYQTIGGISGGVEGGAADLSDRTGTGFHSSAKRALIKDFQHILLKLGMEEFKGVEDLDEVLKLMRKRVPDPRKGKGNGLSWGKDKQGQVAVCKTLAAAINERAPGLIDIKASPDDLCRQISEVVYDLFGGLSAELLTSRTNLEKAIKNLRHLKKFLDDNFKMIEQKLNADRDSTLGPETSTARSLHHDLLEEVDRDLAKLQMMIDTVVQPSQLELAELERDSEEFRTLVKKINKDFGTREAGRKISYTLTGFVTAVEAARIVEKTLAKLGISIKQYADANEYKKIKELLSDKDLAALSKGEIDLELYQRAKQDLLKLHYLHDDVAEVLRGKKGGLFDSIDGGEFNPIDGGSDGGNVVGGLKLDKRVKRRQDLKRALIKDFNDRLALLINIVLGAAQHVAIALGDGKQEMSDSVAKFVKALESLPSLQNQYTYFCLTGAVDDIRAREEREKFVSSCKYVVSTIDELLKENKSGHLKDMRDAFMHIVELIDAYVAKFAEGFGPLESWESYTKKMQGAEEGGVDGAGFFGDLWYGKKSDDPSQSADREAKKKATREFGTSVMQGVTEVGKAVVSVGVDAAKQGLQSASKVGMGEAETFLGGATQASYARIANSLDDAIAKITYFHRIAVMRRGLDKASKEFKSYKDDYVKVLADAVAKGRDDNAKSKKAFLDDFAKEDSTGSMNPLYRDFVDAIPAADKGKAESAFAKAKQFAAGLYDSVDNMYKVAEAMDIYMKEFTDAISAHPDDVQSIIKILDDTEIISKWFDNKSGDFVCQVFDSFPGYIEKGVPKFSSLNNDANKLKGAHYYARMAALTNLGRPSVLKDQGHEDKLNIPNPAPGDFTAWATANGRVDPTGRINAAQVSLPGNPYLATMAQFLVNDANTSDDEKKLNNGVAAFEAAQKALKQVSSLKNLLASFVSIGERFGGKDLISKTNISPKLLLQYLNDYIAASAFKLGLGKSGDNYNFATQVLDTQYKINSPAGLSAADSTVNGRNLTLGYTDAIANSSKIAGPLPAADQKALNDHLKGIPAHMAVMMRGIQNQALLRGDMFETSDKLFQLVIKSMTAKILTVIGTFNMFNRPIGKGDGLGYYSDLRLILGGAEQPSIIPEAFELYIRLPLLAEAYRHIFDFDGAQGDRIISMIPEMDGTYSKLISIIFDRARNVTDGNYSDTETRMLIEAINEIYIRFKNSKSPVRDCIEEFIAEVNRRYGVVKSEERDLYKKERDSRYNTKYDRSEEVVDYELNAIDEDDTFVRPSPSDSYRITQVGSGANAQHKHELKIDDDQALLTGLRKNIDTLMSKCKNRVASNTKLGNLRNLSFQTMINARQHELSHATSDKHRYDIVRNSIASLGTFAISSLERSYLLFHETVVAGLSALRLLHKNLNTFETKVYTMWNEYQELKAIAKSNRAAAPLAPVAGLATYGYAAAAQVIAANTQGSSAQVVATANRLITVLGAPSDDQREEAYLRFGLNQEEMFADLFEVIFNHGESLGDLVSVKIDVSRTEDVMTYNNAVPPALQKIKYGERKMAVHLDYSKLREHVYALFNQIKAAMDKFRGLLPDAVLKAYEEYDDVNISTIYSIEKHLIDELLEGRYSSDTQAVALTANRTLDGSNKKVKELLDYFTKRWTVSGEMVRSTNWNDKKESYSGVDIDFDGETLHQFTVSVHKIIYNSNNLTQAPVGTAARAAGVAGLAANTAPDTLDVADKGLLRLLFNTSGKQKLGNQPNLPWDGVYQRYLNVVPIVNDDFSASKHDLVCSFNKLVGAYLVQVYDEPSRTVYLPAINKFVSGSFSSSVMGNKNYNDDAARTGMVFGGANKESILFRSLSVMLRQLATEKNIVGNELEFGKSDLAQIPTYVKERLRANIPVFKKLFTLLMYRSELTKKFVAALNTTQQITGADPAALDKATKSYLLSVLDQVSYGCQSMIQCCQDVATDLADAPKYLETFTDSISEYESLNDMSPFMPVSSLLQVLQDTADHKFLLPIQYLGHPEFKLLYGTRGLLCCDKHSLADAPGMLKLLKEHNDTTDARHHLSEKEMQQFMSGLVNTVKYLADARLYSQQFTLTNAAGPSRFDLRGSPYTGNDNKNWVYQLMNQNGITSLDDTLRLTESNFQREERNKIVQHTEQGDQSNMLIRGERDELIACNIIDLNIVPINLHALMREMPMVNLYNYAYTFDRMIEDLLEQKNIDTILANKDILKLDDVKRPDTMLAALMIKPYIGVDERAYEALVSRIMRGALGIEGLGRPKYLGDELYNKALFGEIYSHPDPLEQDAGLQNARDDGALSRNASSLINELHELSGVPMNRLRYSDIYQYIISDLSLSGKSRADRLVHIRRNVYNGRILIDELLFRINGAPLPRATPAAVKVKCEETILDFIENNISRFSRASRQMDDSLINEKDLHYIEKDDKTGKAKVVQVDVDQAKDVLKSWGKLRFDTRFVRNLFWIANIQRLLRLKLRRDLTWYNSRVVSDHATVASGITELYDHDVAESPNMYGYKY